MNSAILGLIVGWVVAIFLIFLEIFILLFIFVGTAKVGWIWDKSTQTWVNRRGIDLEKLISEENGDASMSRFQFLIFTFVISLSLLLIIISTDPPAFPKSIPWEILALLGISGTSYVAAKGFQSNKEKALGKSLSQNSTGETTSSNFNTNSSDSLDDEEVPENPQ